jgi:hypothetical protein
MIVRLFDAEVVEENLGHIVVIVLTGVNENVNEWQRPTVIVENGY